MWLLCRLLKYACTQGLPQLAAYVLPVALRGAGGVPALLAACAAASPAGWSLLHLAVASGSQATVEVRSFNGSSRCLYSRLTGLGFGVCALARLPAARRGQRFRTAAIAHGRHHALPIR